MIQLKKDGKTTSVLSNEELEYLAAAYLKLRSNKTYQSLSKPFHDYINEFLQDELLVIKNLKKRKS